MTERTFIWFDNKYRIDSISVGPIIVSDSFPNEAAIGDLYFDAGSQTLHVYTGSTEGFVPIKSALSDVSVVVK